MHTDRYSSPFPIPVEANFNPYLIAIDTVELGFEGLPPICHAMGNPSIQHSVICPTSLWRLQRKEKSSLHSSTEWWLVDTLNISEIKIWSWRDCLVVRSTDCSFWGLVQFSSTHGGSQLSVTTVLEDLMLSCDLCEPCAHMMHIQENKTFIHIK